MGQIINRTKYVDPMVDVAFKRIFIQYKNKRLIRELLEHVFHVEISRLELVNVEHPGKTYEDRNAVFDLECRSNQIGDFIVEVQVKEQEHFAERALFYSTFPISAQAPKGRWDFGLKPVFFLGLLNFDLPASCGKGNGSVHRFSLRNDETSAQMTDRVQFVFMEVGSFSKTLEECTSFEDKFLYYFKNLPTFVQKPDTQNDTYFDELVAAAEYANLDRKAMTDYERRLKIMRDNQNAEEFAIKKATQKGHEAGLQQGIQQGIEKGIAEGKIEVAKNLVSMGLSPDQIAKATGLTVEMIEHL